MKSSLIWKKFNVLGSGFITLVDVMGDDSSIVQAARVSFGNDVRSYEDIPEETKRSIAMEIGVDSDLFGNLMLSPEHYDSLHSYRKMSEDVFNAFKKIRDADDRTLIRYLMRHQHATPLEMCEIKILVRCPMDVWRQWIRHRTANVNEYSTRYMPAIDDRLTTPENKWRKQSTNNKQGSAGKVDDWPEGIQLVQMGHLVHVVDANIDHSDALGIGYFPVLGIAPGNAKTLTPGEFLTHMENVGHQNSQKVYDVRLRLGVAKEQARKDLPLSTFTEAYWKCDLRNVLGFLALRMDSHAQLEIREYANTLGNEIISKLFPITWEAFNDYHPLRGAMTMSALDIETVSNLFKSLNLQSTFLFPVSEKEFKPSNFETATFRSLPEEWQQKYQTTGKCRELDEFLVKAKRLGIVV